MYKFVFTAVLLALVGVSIGTPLHPMLKRHVPLNGNEVGYHVSIQVNDWWNDIPRHSCSGTLLNANWVLTTAKCVHQAFDNLPAYHEVTIQGGDPNLQGYYTSHPELTVVHDESDIGLIKVMQPMRETYCCAFADLPTGPLKSGDVVKGVLTGQSAADEWKLELASDISFEAIDTTNCGDLSDVAPHSLCSIVPVNSEASSKLRALVEPNSSEVPEDPSTPNFPTEPTASEAPVEPTTSDVPTEATTSEAPVEPSTSEVPANQTTSEGPVSTSTSGVPTKPTTTVAPPSPTCFADVGGPLVQDGVVVGLLSRGSGCVGGSTFTVLTDVSAFTNWIQDTIQKYGEW
ncbi:hypothetical protein FOCC_FOCC007468 [Frankliniella occidentalis]|uniref:Uncharacterized protein LOC113210247 n=1 Tax=Frankliniella occidentalis TaxID=133901 RepID=A0A9C6TY39_FRAOC|nr:uncharacterized protein LOC113210247 [Frankliniella occidentalis]KAE8745821.1 hypothetical protein FOCC_FOCC007468 [Frankliniella occidentalis]